MEGYGGGCVIGIPTFLSSLIYLLCHSLRLKFLLSLLWEFDSLMDHFIIYIEPTSCGLVQYGVISLSKLLVGKACEGKYH